MTAKFVEIEYYDVTSLTAFKYLPNSPPLLQCFTFRVIGELIHEDAECLVVCTERETSIQNSDEHPYREVTIIPKNWLKDRPKRIKKKDTIRP